MYCRAESQVSGEVIDEVSSVYTRLNASAGRG